MIFVKVLQIQRDMYLHTTRNNAHCLRTAVELCEYALSATVGWFNHKTGNNNSTVGCFQQAISTEHSFKDSVNL